MKDERLIEAFNAWQDLSQTPDTIIAYHSRLKSIIDEEARLDDATIKGKEESKREVVLNGYKNGIDSTTLGLLTSYTVEQVEAIIAEFKKHEK